VTDASLEKLKAMPKLNQLFVYGTKVSDEGVKKLKAAMPKLKTDKDIPPVKEVTQPAKKDEMKKGEAKKEEAKKKEEPKKKEEAKKEAPKKEEVKKKEAEKKPEAKKAEAKKEEPKKK
jgi:FK506-binding nuclear protein